MYKSKTNKLKLYLVVIFSGLLLTGCGIYSFTGGNVGDAKTLQIDYFRNEASLIEPTLSQLFTQELQDLFTTQTNLTLVNANADLHFEGEIVGYEITPMSATGNDLQTAAQNRLTVTINVRFTNKLKEEDDFEKRFSFYSDFDATEQLVGSILDTALEEINDRITQDIFNASVAKW